MTKTMTGNRGENDFRLKSNAAFAYVYRKGTAVHSRYFTLLTVKSRYHKKVGFTVGKKVGNAVTRNRTKRLLREGFRALAPTIADYYTYVFIAKDTCVGLSCAEMTENMRAILQKAQRLIPQGD